MGISVEAWRLRIGCFTHSSSASSEDDPHRNSHRKRKCRTTNHDCVAKVLPVEQNEELPSALGAKRLKTASPRKSFAQQLCAYIPNLRGYLSAGLRLLLLIGLLLLVAGDVEANPGPSTTPGSEQNNGEDPAKEELQAQPISPEQPQAHDEEIAKYEEEVMVYLERGKEPFKRGEFDVAAEHLSRALEYVEKFHLQKGICITPLLANVYFNRCLCYQMMGEGHYLMALKDLHKAIVYCSEITMIIDEYLVRGNILLSMISRQIRVDNDRNQAEEAKRVIEVMKKDGIIGFNKQEYMKALAIYGHACKLAHLLRNWRDKDADVILADMKVRFAETWFALITVLGLDLQRVVRMISVNFQECLDLIEDVHQSELVNNIKMKAQFYRAQCFCKSKMYKEAKEAIDTALQLAKEVRDLENLKEKDMLELRKLCTEKMEAISGSQTAVNEEWLEGTNIAEGIRAKRYQEKIRKRYQESKTLKVKKIKYKQVPRKPEAGRQQLKAASAPAPVKAKEGNLPQRTDEREIISKLDKLTDTSIPDDRKKSDAPLEYKLTTRGSGISRDSGQVVGIKAKFPLQDVRIQLACSSCCVESENSGDAYWYDWKAHENCYEDRLLLQRKGGKLWLWIKAPLYNTFTDLCKTHLHGRSSPFPVKKCKYPHSKEEKILWKKEQRHEFKILNFIDELRYAYHPKPKTPQELIQKYGGKLVFVCRKCFFMKPTVISWKVKDKDCCENGHRWKVEGFLLVHESIVGTGRNRIPIRERPRGYAESDMYQRCAKGICTDVDCPKAHFDIERDVWHLETINNWSRKDFIRNLKKLNSHDKKTQTMKNTLGTVIENTEVLSARIQHLDSISSASTFTPASEVKCQEKVQYACRKCYIKNRNLIVGPSVDFKFCYKQLHPWNPDTYLCVVRLEDGKYCEIRELPDVKRDQFDLCVNIKSFNRCFRGKECTYAHSTMEKSLWEWMQKNGVLSLDELVIASERSRSSLAPKQDADDVTERRILGTRFCFPKFYCKYCYKECNSKIQLERHFSSQKHKSVLSMLNRSDQSWNCREPPPNLIDFKLCKRHCEDGETCLYSGVEDHLNLCPFAHSEEELGEWNQRAAQKDALRSLMKETKVYPYLNQVYEDYLAVKDTEKEKHLIVYDMKGIDITPNPQTEEGKQLFHKQFQDEIKNDDKGYTFTVKVDTSKVDLKLERASLLLFKHRDHFGIETDGGDTVQLIAGDSVCSNVDNNTYELRVLFKTFIFGTFEQILLLDFGQRPFLGVSLKVDVGTEQVLRKLFKVRKLKQIPRGHVISDYIPCASNPTPLQEVVGKYLENTWDSSYNLTSLFDKKELNHLNYVRVMHQLLMEEQKEQASLVQGCRIKAGTEVMTHLPPSLHHIKTDKHLFAKISMDENLLQFGRGTVELLLTSVSRCYVQLVTSPSSEFYEVEVLNYQDFIDKGRTRDSIYLALSAQCCQDLDLIPETCTYLTVQFKLDVTNFQLMHLALERLDANLDVFFPDYTLDQPMRDCLPGELKKIHSLEEKKVDILKNILSEPVGDLQIPPTIILGAFGTGKTYILKEAVALLMKDTSKRVLICCKFDSAADLYVSFIEHKLMEHSKQASKRDHPLRIYGIEKEKDYKDVKYSVCTRPSQKQLDRHRIIITTLSASMLLKFGPSKAPVFTHIFIDEAGQALEPELVMPLSLADPKTLVVLAGDNRQLLPKIYSRVAKDQHFEMSLLQRLFHLNLKQMKEKAPEAAATAKSANQHVFHLTINYRSTPEISQFLGQTFYQGHLHCAAEIGSEKGVPPLSFWVTRGEEKRSGASYYNIPEAKEVMMRVQYLIGNGKIKPSNMAVVTPYEGQMLVISEMLEEKRLGAVKTEIVENIQGLEFDAIILSTVRTCSGETSSGALGFLENSRLLNTAMGRARRHILVVGDPFTLCSIGSCRTIWKHYIDECREKSSLYPDIGCEIVEEILGKDYQRLGGTENGKETTEHHETAKSICTDTTARDSGYSSMTGSGDSEFTSEIDSDKDDELSDEDIFKNLEKQWKDDEQFVSSKEISKIQDEIHFERDGNLEDEHSTNTLHDMKLDTWLYQTHRYARGADDEEMNEGEAEDEDDDRDLNEHFYDFFVKDIDQKETYYEHHSKIELMDMLKREPSKFKICTLYIQSAQKGFAAPVERNEPVPRINLYGRSNCGMAFDKTEVVVRLNNPPTSDKINLDTDFHGKVIGTWSQVKVRKFTKFVCTVDEFRIDLMKPLNKTVPKIHVMNPTGTDNRIAVYSSDKDGRLNVKRWEPVDLRLRDSKVFVVRCLKWSPVFQYPLGYVVKVLPAGTDFTNAQEILKIQYQLSQKFPVDVEKKKRALMRGLSKRSQKVPEDEEPKTSHLPDDFFTNREDCRQLHCFTIDPKDSEDLDDALSVDFCEDDTVRVGVHIADVSAFVEPGDPIDQEAALRSRTFYPAEMPDTDERSHPEKPYHMLPTELSTNFCSLLEGKDRVAISVFFKFDKNGNITIGNNGDDLPGTPEIKRTVIRSKRQLSYKDSEDILRDSEKEMGSYLTDSLIFLHKAAEHLRHNRLKEAAKFVHADGKESPMSERIIGEFMILTNATIAKILTKTFRYVPLRVHFPPDKETLADWQNQYGAIAELTSYLSHYVKEPQTSPEFITVRQQTWQKMISLAESTEGLSDLKNCLASEEDYPMQFCAMAAWFDVQRPARYVISDPNDSDADYSHFALNVPIYTQVSSPIRRYMDLIVQRLLCDMLDGKTKPTEPSYNNLESMQQICLLYNENSLREKMFSKDCKILKTSLELQKNGQALYSPVVTQIEESSLTLNNPAMSYLPRKYSSVRYGTLGLMDAPVHGQHNDICFKWSKRLYNKEYETAKSTFLPSKMERDFKLYPFQSEVLVPVDCWINLQNPSFWFSGKLKGMLRYIQKFNYRKQAAYHSYVSGDMFVHEQTSKKGSHGKSLVLPECKLALHLTTGNVLETLMSSCVEMGKLRPFVSLLGITPHFKICLSHREDPVKMFSDSLAAHPLMDKYAGIEHYQNVILPVLAIESAACAVANDEAVTIQNVSIVWEAKETENKTVYYGTFTLGDLFCEERNIEFFHEERDFNLEEDNEMIVDCGQYGDYICVIYTRMNKSEETKHSSFPCTSIAKCDPIWCGHGLLITVGKNKRVLFRLLGENIPGAILEQSDSEDGDFKCCVEIIQKTLPNRRMEGAVHELAKATDLAQSIAIGNLLPEDSKPEALTEQSMEEFIDRENNFLRRYTYLPGFNENQRKAVCQALSRPFTLIQGPPGTGKSLTGIRIVYLFVKWNEATRSGSDLKQVLYCGPSNKSVDVVTGLLKKRFNPRLHNKDDQRPSVCPKIVRVYGENVVQREFPVPLEQTNKSERSTDSMQHSEHSDVALHHIIRHHTNPYAKQIKKYDAEFGKYFKNPKNFDAKRLENDIRRYRDLVSKAEEHELRHHDVVLCTCSVSSSSRVVTVTNFEQCIVDECGMCIEADSLIPIVSSRARQVVLIGDHKQLRPIVLSQAARDLRLETSLFERYANEGRAIMLDIQYRMHRDIVEFPSQEFYSGKLKTGHSQEMYEDEEKSLGRYVWQGSKRYRFCHVEGKEETLVVETPDGGEQSKRNEEELEHVVRLYRTFVKGFNISKKRVIVLSQYRAQVSRVQEVLSDEFGRGVNVSTVVQSQGGEWDIVIFTTVRSLPQYQIIKNPTQGWCRKSLGFITDEHQINVALTRARKGLIIIGNKNLLGCHPVWNRLLQHYNDQNAVVNAEDFLRGGIKSTEFYKNLAPRMQRQLDVGTFYQDDGFYDESGFKEESEEEEDSTPIGDEEIQWIDIQTGNRLSVVPQEKRMPESLASPQMTADASESNKQIDVLKDTYLRRFSITPEGGHVDLKEVGVFLLVPPGALAETTEMFIGISWREEDMLPLPSCQTRASPVVVCGPHGLTFRKPVFLSFYHCISGTRHRKMGRSCPENLTRDIRMSNPFYIWQSQTHLHETCRWKVLSSDSVVLTNTKCIMMMQQFCKHTLSCDSKRLCALVFGSFKPQHVTLLKLKVYCVNDTPDEIKNVTAEAREDLQMEMLDAKKKFKFFTCGYSESSDEEKKSYDVSLLLEGFEKKWKMHEDSPQKVMNYIRLCENNEENITFSLCPKKKEESLNVFVSKIYVKQEGKDQEEDIKCITSTELEIHWSLPIGPTMDNYNFTSYSGGLESVRPAPILPGGEMQRHGGNHFQSIPNQFYNPQGQYQQFQPGFQPNIGNQQDDFQSQTAGEMVAQGQFQQNLPTLQPYFGNQRFRQGNFQSQTVYHRPTGPNQWYPQQGQSHHRGLPQGPVTDWEQQGDVSCETSRKSVHESPPLPPQRVHMAAGDQDSGVTDPYAITTVENSVPHNQAHGGNQLGGLPTVMQGIVGQILPNTGNTNITVNYQVNNLYSTDKESMPHMKKEDVTNSFRKHVPSDVIKQLKEALTQRDVWDQVKKMYGISDENSCPLDVVDYLLSQVEGCIASFINVLLRLKEAHAEGEQDIPQDLIDKVKEGLMSEMEYKKLRENMIDFAEDLIINFGRVLDYLSQFNIMTGEEIAKLKSNARENPQGACRNLFQVLLAISPKKEPIKYLRDAFRDSTLEHLADELEVSYQDVEDELQEHGGGGDLPSWQEPLAMGLEAPPTSVMGQRLIAAH